MILSFFSECSEANKCVVKVEEFQPFSCDLIGASISRIHNCALFHVRLRQYSVLFVYIYAYVLSLSYDPNRRLLIEIIPRV